MTIFMTDTHAIIWRLVAPSKLALAAVRAWNDPGRVFCA